jgi:hypothetical protein
VPVRISQPLVPGCDDGGTRPRVSIRVRECPEIKGIRNRDRDLISFDANSTVGAIPPVVCPQRELRKWSTQLQLFDRAEGADRDGPSICAVSSSPFGPRSPRARADPYPPLGRLTRTVELKGGRDAPHSSLQSWAARIPSRSAMRPIQLSPNTVYYFRCSDLAR